MYTFRGTGIPERVPLTGLDNWNIQSSFYPGKNNALWFCTYNRIIQYDLQRGHVNSYPIVLNKDTFNSDYYIFKVDTLNNVIWGKQDIKIIVFNTEDHTSTLICDSIDGRRITSTRHGNSDFLLSYYYTSKPLIIQINKPELSKVLVRQWVNWPEKCSATDISFIDSAHALIATNKGLFIGDIVSGKVSKLFGNEFIYGINSIGNYQQNSWLFSPNDRTLMILKKDPYNLYFNIEPFEPTRKEIQGYRILTGDDNTIFISSKDEGVYFFHPDKIKFTNWDTSEISVLSNNRYPTQRLQKLCLEAEMTSKGTPFTFHQNYHLVSTFPHKSSLIDKGGKTYYLNHPESSQLYRYFKGNRGEIYAGFLEAGLYALKDRTWEKVPFPAGYSTLINFYYPVNDTLGIASINQEKLIFWNPDKTNANITERFYSGDIYNTYHPIGADYLFISTDQGLLKVDLKTFELNLVNKEEQYPCFCLLPDDENNIWYSSASKIFKYDKVNQIIQQFNVSDGVYEGDYGKRRCERLSKDSLLFFYNGGSTLVRPSFIKSINLESKIFITSFKVNDIDHEHPEILNYTPHFITKYEDNTLSFEINSVDWSDPVNADLQFKLEGYDNHWVMPEKYNAFVRYPKLPPGEYNLLIKGANADGIWNDNTKNVRISVIPPFWMRWWFIVLVIITTGFIIYRIFKIYYNRKLERKNHIIEKQSLIIEKQQAVENERTRIASEMHDDLGSGLTTIRYLSDKALIQAKDSEEATQIKKIADHSNTLVRNMSEIIWAMNSRFDNTENLIGYLRRYASEFLDERQMPFSFESTGQEEIQIIRGEKRRNIFLVFKELLHNSIKYSNAQSIDILIETKDTFTIRISEIGGKGFDPESSIEKGNGLFNSKKRLAAIGGELNFKRTAEAMHIIISVPVNTTSFA